MVCAFDASDLMSRLFMGDAHCRPGGLSLPHRIVVSEAEWKWDEVQAYIYLLHLLCPLVYLSCAGSISIVVVSY